MVSGGSLLVIPLPCIPLTVDCLLSVLDILYSRIYSIIWSILYESVVSVLLLRIHDVVAYLVYCRYLI